MIDTSRASGLTHEARNNDAEYRQRKGQITQSLLHSRLCRSHHLHQQIEFLAVSAAQESGDVRQTRGQTYFQLLVWQTARPRLPGPVRAAKQKGLFVRSSFLVQVVQEATAARHYQVAFFLLRYR